FTQTNEEYVGLSDIHPDAADREITREEFELRSYCLIRRIIDCCRRTLAAADAKANINAQNINHVLLVGGASKMNFVTGILSSIFPPGTDFSKSVSGEEAIAKGATIYAAKLSQVSQSPVINNLEIHDALPLSIGV